MRASARKLGTTQPADKQEILKPYKRRGAWLLGLHFVDLNPKP